MRKITFANQEIYHIYNRGTDKRDIFYNDKNRIRFMNSLILFNEVGRISNKSIKTISVIDIPQNPCVEILAFCLMPNHYHLLLRQVTDGGISEYMHRLKGYSRYFNLQNNRSGRLFEGVFKAKHINTTKYLNHISRYIHQNPLDLCNEKLKNEKNLTEQEKIFLEKYEWSSYSTYLNYVCRPYITSNAVLSDFTNIIEYQHYVNQRQIKSITS